MSRFIYILPLTVIPLIIYLVWGSFDELFWARHIITDFQMISGRGWNFSVGDLLLVVGVLFLYFEILKATNSTTRAIVNHTISVLVFIAYLMIFLLVPMAASSVFFILMILALFDVVAGFSITIKVARRDFGVGLPPGAQGE